MRKSTLFALSTLIILLALPFRSQPVLAQSGSASDLIAAVNALREASGLTELQTDPILMSVAQAHSDYQASIGQVTHTGEGNLSPYDRALAAGFGGGNNIFLAENIAGGNNLSPSGAIAMWEGDQAHLDTMLKASSTRIGAGVAASGSFVYYTIEVGSIDDDSSAPEPAQADTSPTPSPEPRSATGPTPISEYAVLTVTPYPDGSVIHIVQSGHTLYTIAEAYNTTVQAILDLNNRRLEDRLYVGDKLLVRAANTATPTLDVTLTPTMRPATATRRPTRTATALPPTPTATATPTVTPTATPTSVLGTDPVGNVMMGSVVFLLVIGILMVFAGVILKRKSPPPG